LHHHHAPQGLGSLSGHVAGFNDPMVDCKHCKARFRADHLKKGDTLPEKAEQKGRRV
jgi:glycyl-tRNA synthetase (class II)